MRRTPWWISVLLGAAMCLLSPALQADESDPLPAPRGTPQERAVRVYNEGVRLLRNTYYAAAQEQFEQALALDEALAEAHNNLAFSLRMQGPHHLERALHHYNRALELKTDLAQAYMYRGVLFTSMGDYASPAPTMRSSWRSTRSSPPSSNTSSPAGAMTTAAWRGRTSDPRASHDESIARPVAIHA